MTQHIEHEVAWGEAVHRTAKHPLFPNGVHARRASDNVTIAGGWTYSVRFIIALGLCVAFVGVMAYVQMKQGLYGLVFVGSVIGEILGVLLGCACVMEAIRSPGISWVGSADHITISYGRLLFRQRLRVAKSVLVARLDVCQDTESGVGDGHGMVLLRLSRSDREGEFIRIVAGWHRDIAPAFRLLAAHLGEHHSIDNTRIVETGTDGAPVSVCRMPLAQRSVGCASFQSATFVPKSDTLLLLRPTKRAVINGLLLIIAGLVVASMGIAPQDNRIGAIGHTAEIIFGVFLAALGLWLAGGISRRIAVDAQRQVVSACWLVQGLATHTIRFEDVLAIQLCSRALDPAGYTGDIAHELNLVLARQPSERITLICHCDGHSVAGQAHMLAEFMKKPLLNHATRNQVSRRGRSITPDGSNTPRD